MMKCWPPQALRSELVLPLQLETAAAPLMRLRQPPKLALLARPPLQALPGPL